MNPLLRALAELVKELTKIARLFREELEEERGG